MCGNIDLDGGGYDYTDNLGQNDPTVLDDAEEIRGEAEGSDQEEDARIERPNWEREAMDQPQA